jgi:hypothetical protein
MKYLIPDSAFALNCRLLCYLKGTHPYSEWHTLLAQLCGLPRESARQLMNQEQQPAEEIAGKVALGFGVDSESLRFHFPVLKLPASNLNLSVKRVLSELPHGWGKRVAKDIGVRPEQLSRWGNGEVANPEITNVRTLLKKLSMEPDLDLEAIPLFLSLIPVAPVARKRWMQEKIEKMPPEELERFIDPIARMLWPHEYITSQFHPGATDQHH